MQCSQITFSKIRTNAVGKSVQTEKIPYFFDMGIKLKDFASTIEDEYIAPELFLLLMTTLITCDRRLLSAIIFCLCIIICLLVVPVTYVTHT